MKAKHIAYQAISIIVLVATVLGCVLTIKTIFPWFETGIVILCVLPLILIMLTEVCSCIKYFIFGLQQSKVQTFLITLRLICGIGTLLLAFICLLGLQSKQFWARELPPAIGTAIFLLGIAKLIYSIWEIVRYWRNALERKVSKVLLLAYKMIFALLVVYIGFWIWLWAGFASALGK